MQHILVVAVTSLAKIRSREVGSARVEIDLDVKGEEVFGGTRGHEFGEKFRSRRGWRLDGGGSEEGHGEGLNWVLFVVVCRENCKVGGDEDSLTAWARWVLMRVRKIPSSTCAVFFS